MQNNKRADDIFNTIGVFEYLSLGDRERIHTEMLHWILSEHSMIEVEDKIRLLGFICDEDLERYKSIKNIITEDNNMDITFDLISADGDMRHVVIENKFKSKEGRNQLSRYDEKLRDYSDCVKIFLTPLGEKPKSGENWKPASYDKLLKSLRQIRVEKDLFVQEYKQMLERFICAVNMVRLDPERYAPVIFNEKSDEGLIGFKNYIKHAKIEKLLQMVWMEGLALKMLENHRISADRQYYSVEKGSAGTPLLDVIVGYIANKGNGEIYRLGIQLQNKTFKIFCSPLKYDKERLDVKEKDIELLLIELLKPLLSISLKREKPTKSRTRGFRSFVHKPVWSWKYEEASEPYLKILPMMKNALENCPEGYVVKKSCDIEKRKGVLDVVVEWPC